MLYRFLLLLKPLTFFFIIDVPFSILGLMKGFFYKILNCGFQNYKYILVFVLNSIILFDLLILVFILFIFDSIFLKKFFSLFLDLHYLFRRLKDTVFNLLDIVDDFPLFHSIFPSISSGVDLICSQQDIQIS